MIKLVFISGPRNGEEIPLSLGSVLVGRADDCGVVLEDSSVSGHHCQLLVSEFGVKVSDLGSTNGTCVDQQPIRSANLKDGQILTLGNLALRLVHPPAHIAVPDLPAPEATGPNVLASGEPACQNHADIPATRRCLQCGRTFCDACVHELKLSSGASRISCPACSGLCEPLVEAPKPQKPSGLRSWIDTVRLRFIPPKRK